MAQISKLTKVGLELLISRILAGDSFAKANAALESAHFEPVSRQSYHYYKRRPDVQHAIKEQAEKLRSQGLGERAQRVRKLCAAAERLERRLMKGAGRLEDPLAEDALDGKALHIYDRFLKTLRLIALEVESNPRTDQLDVADRALADIVKRYNPEFDGEQISAGIRSKYLELDAS